MTHGPHYIPPERSPQEGSGSSVKWLMLGGLLVFAGWKKLRHGTSSHDDDDGDRQIDREALERGHEPEGANVWGVVGFATALLVMLLLVFTGIAALQGLFEDEPAGSIEPPGVGFQRIPPPAPQLQAEPALDLQVLRRREDSLLHTYGWANEQRTAVRIPIERAMDLIAERGLPHGTTAADTIRVLTESGYVWMPVGQVPPPGAPAYPGPLTEPYAPSADLARRLGLVTTERESEVEDGGS